MALPTSMRLRGHRCFNRLHRSGRRHHGAWMVLRVMQGDNRLLRAELRNQPRCCRCALVISGKVSKPPSAGTACADSCISNSVKRWRAGLNWPVSGC